MQKSITENLFEYEIKNKNKKNNMYYAGIGARDIPNEYFELFKRVGKYLATKGFILRSGGANGSDKAFEIGCDMVQGSKEIFLPWKNFEGSDSKLIVENEKAFAIAEQYHPYYKNLSAGAKKLQARNSHQILGWDLSTLSDFVICYTKGGKGSGGTGQALRIAKSYNVPIFDTGAYKDINVCRKELLEFLNNFI